MLHRDIMPTTWLLVAIILMVALRLLLPQPLIVPQPWHLVGLVPLALGVLINLVADGALRQAATTVKPYEEPSALIEGGAFRASRNPMYLGFVSILLGVGLLLRTALPFAVVPAFAILMDRGYIAIEERALAGKFGSRWDAYRRGTRRWV
jgi:protein-S-isoprenylcysteine O-methyltransferase Ste14